MLTGPELADLYKDLATKYPIVSIEDPFDQVRVNRVVWCADLSLGGGLTDGRTDARSHHHHTTGRLGQLHGLHGVHRREGAGGRRRPPRHQPQAHQGGRAEEGLQRPPPQGPWFVRCWFLSVVRVGWVGLRRPTDPSIDRPIDRPRVLTSNPPPCNTTATTITNR